MTIMIVLLLAAVVGASPSAHPAKLVALTFDDLPAAGTKNPNDDKSLSSKDVRNLNAAILRVLNKHRAPAIGFVNEKGIAEAPARKERLAVLKAWLASGMQLGNHTYSHADFDQLSVTEFKKEIATGEASIRPLLAKAGKPLEYFRFPYNHTGDTPEKNDAISRYLSNRSYKLATCTIDNEDYLFEHAYGMMLEKHDESSAQKLKAAYLRHTGEKVDYYAGLHRQVLGYKAPQVMLLHANRLNGAVFDQVLELFVQRGYRFMSLAAAQSDPAFRTPDTFVTKYGMMWGYRWARVLGVKVDGSKEAEPPKWIVQYGISK